ncbi:hypothetical protein RlegWSM1455_27875 (plasmid) [Rhizobium laguerreae]|uniref:hypothetical protein n=1 Tax=Rhizobium laguerreae TaxID=1076926 RepID=UPI001E62FDEB|nr:hypothetical protein [Rhizobium laguerreae]UFW67147.1 hypothetical protein RlegWSM1455_27875 [Rhizobium laguerreae]
MTDTDAELLRTFIADENEAFADRRQGKFWPANHYRIGPLATKASGLLDPKEQVDFYFHFMRVAGWAPLVGDREMPLLLEAYRRMLPFLDLGGSSRCRGGTNSCSCSVLTIPAPCRAARRFRPRR